MGFTQANRREVEQLLSKITTTADALGRTRRDVLLIRRLNPHWDTRVWTILAQYENLMGGLLRDLDAHGAAVVNVLNEVAPQEE